MVQSHKCCRGYSVRKDATVDIRFPKADQIAHVSRYLGRPLWTLAVLIGLLWQFMHRLCMRKLL